MANSIKLTASEFAIIKTKADLFGSAQDKLRANIDELNSKLKGQNTMFSLQKENIARVVSEIDKYKAQNDILRGSIEKKSNAIKEELKLNGENSDEYKKLTSELGKLQKEYNQNDSAMSKNESSLNSLKLKLNQSQVEILQTKGALNKLGDEFTQAGNKSDELGRDLKELEGNLEKVNGADMSMIGQGLMEVGEKAGEAGKKILGTLKDLAEEGFEYSAKVEGTKFILKGLDQTTQDLINTNSQSANTLGMTSNQYKDSAVQLANYQKTMGFTNTDINGMNASTLEMIANLGAIKDVPFEEAMSAYQSMLKGNFEAGDALNISMSANTLANTDYIKSLGKSWNELSELEKMTGVYLETQRQATSSNGLAKQEAEQAGMQYKLMKVEMKETAGMLGDSLVPALTPLIEIVRNITVGFAKWTTDNPKLASGILITVGVIGGLLAIIAPLITFVGMATIAWGALSTVMAGSTIAFAPIIATIGIVVGVIAILVMAIKANFEGIKNAFIKLGEECKPQLDALKETFINMGTMMKSIYYTVLKPTFMVLGKIIEQVILTSIPIIKILMDVFVDVMGLISLAWFKVGLPVFNFIKDTIVALAPIFIPIFNLLGGLFKVACGLISFVWNGTLMPIFTVIIETIGIIGRVVGSVFGAIGSAMLAPFTWASGKINDAINRIKSFLNFQWEFPHLKMPHFNFSGSMNPLKWGDVGTPKIGVNNNCVA